ncbi:DUF2490 domain-containing protein [Segetibacter sp. 3557_3]|uniref:DUF2490 domain-containing protein n=1 Tax=Segetibacter sp. 3557_3 TaxID=2547429 RepID=UPI0010590E1A|nr:DUF2490 domain-containing protein [Segetibacter sp. 3557_3]TDH29220.1 DUF2490 domain-containing protein [Segetibacter sp. 3557_3]
MLKKLKLFKANFFLLAFFISIQVNGQTPGLGTWNVINGKFTFNNKWSTFFEAQARSQKFYYDFHYHEYKGGIGYNFRKQLSVVVAMGQYVTYSPDANFKTVQTSEFRTWQQFTVTNDIDRVKLEHRYRVEQRFFSSGFRNRFRYRVNAILPLNKREVETNTVYLNSFNEIFLNNRKPHFERNRFFLGVGYQFSELFTLQSGYLRQYDYRADGAGTVKDYFQTSLLFSINESRSERGRRPGSVD